MKITISDIKRCVRIRSVSITADTIRRVGLSLKHVYCRVLRIQAECKRIDDMLQVSTVCRVGHVGFCIIGRTLPKIKKIA